MKVQWLNNDNYTLEKKKFESKLRMILCHQIHYPSYFSSDFFPRKLSFCATRVKRIKLIFDILCQVTTILLYKLNV